METDHQPLVTSNCHCLPEREREREMPAVKYDYLSCGIPAIESQQVKTKKGFLAVTEPKWQASN